MTLHPEKLELCKQILAESFKSHVIQAYLFGSRARESASCRSDVDIAIKSDDDLSIDISKARERFEESTLPQEVDLIEYNKGSDELKREIDTEGVLIWKS